ncbi:conserved protein of unknown function [Methylorubrum extorquens]|uniref:Uncharacterized protein n=1 Tax=Methylorubrum extorquens TaxID=408 RepID=A0A2N9AN34_METEX|nr:hypothetical protein ASF36_24435 [Methylobacterium sp. Leaf90]SOR28729.1 conserved protein of unknown function [Methylorubrum extorquens]
MFLREAEVQVLNVTRTAVAQELVEIIIHRAQRGGTCPAQMLREHGRRLALLTKLAADMQLQAVLAELDRQATRLELSAGVKISETVCA